MCGINGIIFKNSPVDTSKILAMNELLKHRGPDQSGYVSHNNLLLGHTRLSILDISKKGFQPMTTDGRYWIIYNGEVYNFKDLKKELISKNYKFFSETDTEVVLNSFREWGIKSFNKFNGEWALAILDKVENSLIICRDGIGYKPCYIFENNKYFGFSSEMKSLLPIDNLEFSPSNLGINTSTLQSTANTIFKNVDILRHGYILKINLKDFSKSYERWDYPLTNLPKINSGYKENVKDFYSLLYSSTKIRLNSDVKIGTSLSGGLDSSAIFSVLNSIEKNELNNNSNLDLNPLIVNYEGMRTKDFAINLAKKYQKKFDILEFHDQDIANVQELLTSLETTEEFFMQESLYKSQSKKGIKVSIDGHGADEFLWYPGWLPQVSVETLNSIVDLYKIIIKFGNTNSINQFKKLFGLREMIPNKISFQPKLNLDNYFSNYVYNNRFESSFQYIDNDIDDLKNFSYDFSYTYLMSYCGWFQFFLNKWDRASMSNSIEVRMPFLDKELRLFNLAIPKDMKYHNENTKSILRDAFKDQIQSNLINQNFKQGLNKQNFQIDSKNKDYMFEIFSQNDFKNISMFNHQNINKDLSNSNNFKILWELCKNYLILSGFRNNFKNIVFSKEKKEEYNYLKD